MVHVTFKSFEFAAAVCVAVSFLYAFSFTPMVFGIILVSIKNLKNLFSVEKASFVGEKLQEESKSGKSWALVSYKTFHSLDFHF